MRVEVVRFGLYVSLNGRKGLDNSFSIGTNDGISRMCLEDEPGEVLSSPRCEVYSWYFFILQEF
jgi:hypothetical protein